MSAARVAAYSVVLQTLSGGTTPLPPLQPDDTVYDLARAVRSALGIPISVQQLVWQSTALKNRSERLQAIFGENESVSITVVRRPYTPDERAELHKRLVRATAAGRVAEVHDLLKEGAQVDFEPESSCADTSRSLSHWEDDLEAEPDRPAEASGSRPAEAQQGERGGGPPSAGMEEGGEESEGDDMSSAGSEGSEEDVAALAATHPCGGISPLLMALASGQEALAQDFRALGAEEADLTPKASGVYRNDFAEIVRHLAQGVDVDTRMARGRSVPGTLDVWAIWPGSDLSFANPLHACAALHRRPGAYETAQLLIRLKADLNAGDAEGDTPLAHARYFMAAEFFSLYSGVGAKLAGPYYARFEEVDA